MTIRRYDYGFLGRSHILQAAVNSMGEVIVASVTAGSRISMLVCCPFETSEYRFANGVNSAV